MPPDALQLPQSRNQRRVRARIFRGNDDEAFRSAEFRLDPNAAFFRIPHASAYTGISIAELYRLIAAGKLLKVNIGRSAFICGDSLRAFIGKVRSGE